MKAMQKILALILALCALVTVLPVSSAEEALSAAQIELLTENEAAEIIPAEPTAADVPVPEAGEASTIESAADAPAEIPVEANTEPASSPAFEAAAEPSAAPAGAEAEEPASELPAEPAPEATTVPPAVAVPEITAAPAIEPAAEPSAVPTIEPVPESSAASPVEPAGAAASAMPDAANHAELLPTERIEFDSYEYTISAGETLQLNPMLYPLDQPHAVRYGSSHPGIASVDENGLVTGITGGKVFITVTDALECSEGYHRNTSLIVTVESDQHRFITSRYNSRVLVGYEGVGGHVVIPEGYVVLSEAFKNNKDITSVYIPDSVTEIIDAFAGCTNLESVRLSGNLQTLRGAFSDCTSLGEIEFPKSLETIGNSAFYRCKNLRFDALPDGITAIMDRAFYDCDSLERVVLPKGIRDMRLDSFSACDSLREVILPEGLTHIDGFSDCPALKEIILPDSIKVIGQSAFANSGLTAVHLPEGLETIGYYAFSGCTALESIVIPEGITELQHGIFENCTSLKSAVIPSSVTQFGNTPFDGCPDVVLKVPKNSPAHAYCEENGLRYEFNGEMLTFHIEDGVLYHYYGSDSTVIIPDGVTKIADGAFEDMSFITALHMPASLEEIGNRAFYRCSGLTSLSFPSSLKSIGNEAFYNCESLLSITFPAGLKTIGDRAFNRSHQVSSLEIPAAVEKIGTEAFQECYGLKSLTMLGGGEIGSLAFSCHALERIEIPGNVHSIGESAFASTSDTVREIILHEGVERIAASAFLASNVKELVLPASLTSIADSAFKPHYFMHASLPAGSAAQAYCDQQGIRYSFHGEYGDADAFIIEGDTLIKYAGTAEHVVIPENVCVIGEEAFLFNTSLRTVRFHDEVREISFSAFRGCSSLEELNLPRTPDLMIRNHAFQGCTSLRSITIPGNVTHTGVDFFKDCTSLENVTYEKGYFHVGGFAGCTSLTSIVIPEGVKSIGENAFNGCSSLKEIELPESLTSIGYRTFMDCTALEEIEIPAGVTSLGAYAFQNCTSLTNISLPGKLYAIPCAFQGCTNLRTVYISNGPGWVHKEAFMGCTSLSSVYVPASVKSIEENVFLNCPNLTVITPSGSAAAKYCQTNGIPWAKPDAVATAVSFPEGNLTLGVGQAYQLECETDSDYALGTVSFSSSSAKVVSVDKVTGEIKALKTGSATITAKAQSGAKATCKITVKKAPASVSFDDKEIILGLGESMQLSCTLPKDTAAGLTFEGSNFFALQVEPDGRITAIGTGTDTVTVTTHNGKTDSCTVIVPEAPKQVILEQAEISVPQTLTYQFRPAVNAGSICSSYNYTSSNPDVAAVDESGRLTAHSMGTAEITVAVSALPEVCAVCRVTVTDPPPRIVLAAEEITLGLKEIFSLQPHYDGEFTGSFSCVSSNSKIASVTADGVVAAKKAGSAVITVTGENGLSTACKVTVKKAPSSIKLSASTLALGAGETAKLAYTLSSGSAGSVSFESSAPEVVEIAADGSITAKASGSAEILVKTYNGKKASVKLTVYAAPESVAFERSGAPLKLGVGESGTFTVKFNAGSFGSCSFESSDSDIVEIDFSGKFRAKMLGKCSITVTAYNGASETREVQVCMPPKKLGFDEVHPNSPIGVGQKAKLYLSYYAEGNVPCGPGLSFKSSNTKVATVDVNGVVTGLKPGTATITVTSFNGLKTSRKITVKKAPTAISLNADTLYMGYCETFPLEAVLTPSGSWGNVQYSISDESAAWFDDGMLVANRSSGSVSVTATTYNGLSDTVTIHFGPMPSYVKFPQEEITLCVGMQLPLEFESDGYFTDYSVSSSNKKIAYVNDDGMLVAKKKGTAEITLTTYNMVQAALKVRVEAAPKKHVLSLPVPLRTGTRYNLLDYFSSTPSYDPMLLIKSISINNDCALLAKEGDGWYLLPVKTGSITLTIKTLNSSLRVKVSIVPGPNPDLPDITSPADPSAVFSDYIGTWKLVCLGSISDGLAIPPEMMGVNPYIINIRGNGADIISDDNSLYGFPVFMEGNILILDTIGNKIPSQLHQNGYLTLPQETEGVYLWFERQ